MNFTTTLYNVLIMFLYIVPAFLLRKLKMVEETHLKTVSTLLVYVCTPALVLNSFQEVEYSVENIKFMGIFFATSLIIQVICLLILFFSFKKQFEQAKYRILTIGGIFGNVGFFGLPVIKALFPDKDIVSSYSCIYTVTMNILNFSFGIYALTLDKKFISPLQLLLNPSTLSFLVAIVIYFTKWHFPEVLGNAISILAKMSTAVCMQILGIRLASLENIWGLFTKPFVYLTISIKLIAFPLFAYLCVFFLPFLNKPFVGAILILSGAPVASIIMALSEIYNSEQELAGNIILLSQILCVVTLPVISLLIDLYKE